MFKTFLFFFLQLNTNNPGKSYYARPHDSTQGLHPVFGIIALGIIGYIAFRVWVEMKKDKRG